ncbi:hypothetical protein AVEN_251474-1 [Araneus ventricosus]|uniref:Uncharacterized protein n=1 Tax=Araneus ventricosus TaxID=182803 RepID=A0A4Y2SF83_ARAVE|nr:hypothetical protein AVEN_251474-1 [Araneus ventricosus]
MQSHFHLFKKSHVPFISSGVASSLGKASICLTGLLLRVGVRCGFPTNALRRTGKAAAILASDVATGALDHDGPSVNLVWLRVLYYAGIKSLLSFYFLVYEVYKEKVL